MPYHIKKPSATNSSVDVYYIGAAKGFARWSDDFSKRKQYTKNPTYLTTNNDGKNGGWKGCSVVSE
tara:strand:+ start:854 stop:1051 length:198 start_codon:yes stop_codon:yes gene_type:complete